jgi:transcriptional regulator, Spx/MgsR family
LRKILAMHVYGIKNCNTVKKALTWLEENKISYTFHDFKKEGVSEEKLVEWEKHTGWEPLVNKRGTTWRQLSPAEQLAVVDAASANQLMQAKTSVIKRPVIETPRGIVVGFDESEYKAKLK